jgi:hypothetical protein
MEVLHFSNPSSPRRVGYLNPEDQGSKSFLNVINPFAPEDNCDAHCDADETKHHQKSSSNWWPFKFPVFCRVHWALVPQG